MRKPTFRLRFSWESDAQYKINKFFWVESMIRCGLLTEEDYK